MGKVFFSWKALAAKGNWCAGISQATCEPSNLAIPGTAEMPDTCEMKLEQCPHLQTQQSRYLRYCGMKREAGLAGGYIWNTAGIKCTEVLMEECSQGSGGKVCPLVVQEER